MCLKLAESAMTALKGEMRKAASNPAYVVTILRCLCNIYKYDLNHFLPHRELAELIPSLLTSDLRVICRALKLVSLMVSLLPSTCLEQVSTVVIEYFFFTTCHVTCLLCSCCVWTE